MKSKLIRVFLGFLVSCLMSCTKIHDLNTPCPNYGRHCCQEEINVN